MENSEVFSKKLFRTGVQLPRFGNGPKSDWRIIFFSAVALVVVVMIMSFFVYIKIDKGEIFTTKTSEDHGGKTLDISLLKETVSYYKNKAVEFEKIKSSVVPATDPSL